MPSTASAVALPPAQKAPAHHPHPPAPSADHLGAIFDTESISSLLNRNDDALRRALLHNSSIVRAEAIQDFVLRDRLCEGDPERREAIEYG
ncbi:hypothetical protein HKD34_12465, partial [Gluconobacter sp. R71656]|nr:hypothetical protein [Gluconobacter sp. R71656]